jgi:hypothetical protein
LAVPFHFHPTYTLGRSEKRKKMRDMMEKYDERLQLMKDMERGISGDGDEESVDTDSDEEADAGAAKPSKQLFKFGRAKEGTATVVEVCFMLLAMLLLAAQRSVHRRWPALC